MNPLNETLAADPGTEIATGALAQSTVVPIDDEPAPVLIVEPPLPGPLAQGVAFIPYRVEYAASERVVQQLLTEAGRSTGGSKVVSVAGQGIEAAPDWTSLRTPETYLGYERSENFASPAGIADQRHVYALPKRLKLNQWALSGSWTIGRQATVLHQANGRLVYRFHARDLHLVMGPETPGASVRFRVLIDGQPPGAAHGLDVDEQGNGTVTAQRLYQLIRQPEPIEDREFEIEFLDSGVEVFVFTFG